MKENSPNLVKEIDIHVQEAHVWKRVSIMMDAKRPTPRHNIIKMSKVQDNKERTLKAARENQIVTYRKTS